MFSLNNTSPVSIDIIKKVPPVAGTIILLLAIIGLAVVYTELYSLPKNTFHKLSPFLLSIAKKLPSKSLTNMKFLKEVIPPLNGRSFFFSHIIFPLSPFTANNVLEPLLCYHPFLNNLSYLLLVIILLRHCCGTLE